jgi:hypothetical protein
MEIYKATKKLFKKKAKIIRKYKIKRKNWFRLLWFCGGG